MRHVYASRGLGLMKTPSLPQQAARRRLMVVCAILGLALTSGLIGSLTAGSSPNLAPATGPFSYISQ